jgi:hypothetical protein
LWYEKRDRDDIIYFCTILHEVNLTFNHLTREQDNFHEVPVKLAGQLGVNYWEQDASKKKNL